MWERFSDRFPALAVLVAVLTILVTFLAAMALESVLGGGFLIQVFAVVVLVGVWIAIFSLISDG